MRKLFPRYLGFVIDEVLGLHCASFGYQYSVIVEAIEGHSEHFCIYEYTNITQVRDKKVLYAYCFFENKPEALSVHNEKSKQLELF